MERSGPYPEVFAPDHFGSHPAAGSGSLAAYDTSRTKKRVCVIGGGIAGLAAAYELVKCGHRVSVLEASDRVGGRIRTHYFADSDADGTYGELGAMRIPAEHVYTQYYLRELNLPTRPFVHRNQRAFFFLRGHRRQIWEFPLDETDPLLVAFGVVGQRQAPDLEFNLLINQAKLGLETTLAAEAFADSLDDDRVRRFEALSLWQQLHGVGAHLPPSPSINGDAPGGANGVLAALRGKEWEYIGQGSGKRWEEQASFLAELLDETSLTSSSMIEIPGGMSRFPLELERKLERQYGDLAEIRLRSPVSHVEANAAEVRVRADGGDDERYDYVVCTVPAAATLLLKFTPELPEEKRTALAGLSYGPAAKSLVWCDSRIWEKANHIFGGGSYTDMWVQQLWYPSDNARAGDGSSFPPTRFRPEQRASEREPSTEFDRFRVAATAHDGAEETWEPASEARMDEEGVLTAAYMWGTNARRFASLDDATRDQVVLSDLERLHPGIRQHVKQVVHWCWDVQRNPIGGAYALFGPGERHRYQQALWSPVPEEQPRVFFAGEHVGILHAWIDTSLRTAVGAVLRVLAAP